MWFHFPCENESYLHRFSKQQLLDQVNTTPVITPVLDLTDAERNLQNLQDDYRDSELDLYDLYKKERLKYN